MSGARRRRVGIGDRVLVGGSAGVVIRVSGTLVRMADDGRRVCSVTVAELAGR